ncbi:MAG: CPBP family intramembrane metalloprotease [Siphonobacter sp.]
MRILYTYLADFIRADFNRSLYGTVSLFLIVLITLNYSINLEDGIIDPYRGSWIRFALFLLLDSMVYLSVTGMWLYWNQKLTILRTQKFWLYTLTGLVVLAFWQDYTGYQKLVGRFEEVYSFAFHCFSNLSSALTVWLPLILFYFFIDRNPSYFYGFRPVHLGIHGVMLLCMLPLIIWASFQPSFLNTYPIYKGWGTAEALHWPAWIPATLFEACYGFDFISTELLIRGFFIIGMTKLLDRGAILPMVAVYACIHFGKPLGETIGSIAGGYILGILAYKSRSIWGGIAIHLGVAWCMELAAFIQSSISNHS